MSRSLPAFLVALLFGALAPVEAQPASTLAADLRRIAGEASAGDRVSISVVDARTGTEIFAHHGDLALNPASNMKIVTAAAALKTLGPTFRMRTGLYGSLSEGRVETLYLRGFGDPDLRFEDLLTLAHDLGDQGVERVGRIVVDNAYFDDSFLPPAFEQQPDEMAAFRAAVSAVSVDRSAYVLRILPGASTDARPEARFEAPSYFDVDNSLTTADGGDARVVAVQRPGDDGRLSLSLRGPVPLGVRGLSYRRRVEHPGYYGGHMLVAALAREGIRVGSSVTLGSTPSSASLLASHASEPVSVLIRALGKESDNFTAEMLLKVMGAERAQPGTSARGVEVARTVLEEAGVDVAGVTMVNGSGLFQGNRIAASHLTRLLSYVYRDPSVSAEFVASLAVAGRDGTLAERLEDLRPAGIVRAKTGTLADATALSGYVLGPEPGRAIAFSVIVNGRGMTGAGRALADEVVRAIASDLHPRED
jgi:D-alanyl-D-alanine carboxypeptidase/D-alanyl-D-alanine-endopeptidase (penicillin-binding protein 4)